MIVQISPTDPPIPPTANHLLAALPRTELERLTADAQYERLAAGEVIHRADEPHVAAH